MKNDMPYNVMRHASWDRAPRDPVTLAITTALTPYVGATAASIIAYVAVSVATSLVISALSPKPNFGEIGGGSQGALVNARGALDPQQFVYGTVRKGGTITFYEATGANNKYLHQIICLAGHEIDGFEAFYLNDQEVTLNSNGVVTSSPWNSKVRILAHRGNQTSATDQFANAPTNLQDTLHQQASVESSFIGEGIAYLYVRMEYDQDVFANGVPLVSARIRGKRVFDPRTSTTAYTANAALCIRDFLTAPYGLASRVDDVSFSAAANVCDEDVALAAGGTEKRYETHGVVSSGTAFFDALRKMMTSCGGSLFFGAGEYKLKPSDYTVPVKDLTLDDLRSAVSLDARLSSRDNYNTVRGSFVDRTQDYISVDYPQVTSATFVAEDGGEENAIDMELPFTTSSATAQRIAKLALYRGREQIALTADFSIAAFDLEVGDIVTFTNPNYGFNQKEFEVQNWKFMADPNTSAIKVALALREISEASLDWQAEEKELLANNTTLLQYYDTPTVGISAQAVAKILSEKLLNQLVVDISSAGSERVASVEVQYKPSADSTYLAMGSGSLGNYVVLDLPRGEYDIRARAINPFGYKGEWSYLTNFTVDALSAPPADVSDFSKETSGGTLFLNWSAVPDLDLSYYEIRFSAQQPNDATWGSAQAAVKRIARPATSVTIPIRAGTFLIKAFDKGGAESVQPAKIYVSASELPPYTNTLFMEDNPTFYGAKTNVEINTASYPDELIMTLKGPAANGEYEFDNVLDAGSTVVARVEGTVLFDRYYEDAGLWSKIPQNWLSWPDNFTTWTDEQANFGDYDVQVYAAASTDGTVYGDWALANNQELIGRYFKFKAVLTSENINVSPAIQVLYARVFY